MFKNKKVLITMLSAENKHCCNIFTTFLHPKKEPVSQSCVLQANDSDLDPTQAAPPLAGAGLLQRRVRI